ncbi:MAG: pitrilysin family protein, partial [Bacteroidota bacterium]
TGSAVVEQEGDKVFDKTPSKFDRSIEPNLGKAPLLNPPSIWTSSLANGMDVYGIESNELPLVNFSITLKGGHMLDNAAKAGVASMLSGIMMEGTKNKTPEELEDAIGQLGANINMFTSNDRITISANCLERNYQKTLELVTEILLEPRWDEKEFDILKSKTVNDIKRRSSSPNAIANDVMSKALYGNNILGIPSIGTVESVTSITLDDLKDFYTSNFSPKAANFHIAGSITKEKAEASLAKLATWSGDAVSFPDIDYPAVPQEPIVYFVDVPNAKQSYIMISRLTVDSNSEDIYPIQVANYKLGSGSGGQLFAVLREEKQYTYGASSSASRGIQKGRWTAFSSVKTNVTKEALETFKEVIGNYGVNYTQEQLDGTKNALIKQNTRRYETTRALLGLLQNISSNNLPLDYIDQQQQVLQNMTVEDVKGLVQEYMNLENMYFVIVGDKETQLDRLKVVGVGDPIEVDKKGNPVTPSM